MKENIVYLTTVLLFSYPIKPLNQFWAMSSFRLVEKTLKIHVIYFNDSYV